MARRITESKKSQTEDRASNEALRKSEERYRDLIENINDVIYATDKDGIVTYISPVVESVAGYNPSEIIGRAFKDFIHQEDLPVIMRQFQKVMSGQIEPSEYRILTKAGEIRWVSSSSRPAFKGSHPIGLHGVLTDITQQKRAEEALRESQETYSTVVENSLTGIYIDQDGKIVFANRRFADIYRYSRDELIGMESWKLVHPEDRALTDEIRTKRLKGEEVPSEYEARGLTIDGETIWIARRNIRTDYKARPAILGNIVDVTARKRAENDSQDTNEKLLVEHEQRKLLSRTLITLLENDRRQVAMDLHDHIGQMLTTIRMGLERLLKSTKSTDAALKESTRLAYDTTVRAVEGIHNIAHGLRPTMLDTLGLVPSLRDLFDNMKQHTDMEIHFFHKNVPQRFNAEKELAVYRIAQEALTNVVKHAHARKVFVNLVKENGFITLGLEDDGIGFEKREAMKISKQKGPLGMLIMQERVAQVDGEFSVESRVGGGTHLMAQIPV